MKKVIFIILGLVLVVGFIVIHVTLQSRSYELNYKITVAIETPEGIKMGSAVREISNALQPINLPDVGNPTHVRGEAVVVDLGERGVLFALISHDSEDEFFNAFPTPDLGYTTAAAIRYYDTTLKPGMKAEITKDLPRMVTFTNLSDPKSVKLVRAKGFNAKTQKDELIDNFEELFGEGVKLSSYTLEIIDEPVTWGEVVKRLSWLPDYYSKRLDGNRYGTINAINKTANALSSGAFSTGE